VRPPIGWAAVVGGGSISGIGFTVSLLIAGIAFRGEQLNEAKLGVLSAGLCASVLAWLVFRATALLPSETRIRALLGTPDTIVDLAFPVDPARDHLRGPEDAPVALVEYGDFECPFCGQAEPVVRELLLDSGDVRYVWRHLPLGDVHPRAELAAEAAEAAAAQGAFWEMHDHMLEHQNALAPADLIGYAEELGLDVARFTEDLESHRRAVRVAEDVEGADLSNVTGTPTFFVNGRRHYGAYDIEGLARAVHAARARAAIAT
jgi:protein-disulfide isomerase